MPVLYVFQLNELSLNIDMAVSQQKLPYKKCAFNYFLTALVYGETYSGSGMGVYGSVSVRAGGSRGYGGRGKGAGGNGGSGGSGGMMLPPGSNYGYAIATACPDTAGQWAAMGAEVEAAVRTNRRESKKRRRGKVFQEKEEVIHYCLCCAHLQRL